MFTNQKIKPLKLALDNLINIYNDVPNILGEYVVEVSLTSESYRENENKKVIVEKVIKGGYRVVLLEHLQDKTYYLLPKNNRIKIHRLNSIHSLFNLLKDDDNDEGDFTIIKPAWLKIMPSGENWEILEKGKLYIGKKSPASKLVCELEQIAKKENDIPSSLQELLLILENLNKSNSGIQPEIELLDKRLQKLDVIVNSLASKTTSSVTSQNDTFIIPTPSLPKEKRSSYNHSEITILTLISSIAIVLGILGGSFILQKMNQTPSQSAQNRINSTTSMPWQPSCGDDGSANIGEWWGVQGPQSAFDIIKDNYCGDVFNLGKNTIQIASFRSKTKASTFADNLTQATGYDFWLKKTD